nr:MAG: RNA-dependent RNA polymerase [Hangzhou narna-like virus 2]
MSKNININFLDCMLRGKFIRADEATTHLHMKAVPFSSKDELEELLGCIVSRSNSCGVLLKFRNISCIHLKSAIKAARAVIDCMADADAKLFLRFSQFQLFSIFRSLCSIQYPIFIKTLKYYTAYPLAFFLRNDLPEAPYNFNCKYPFVGNNAIRQWWKHRLMSSSHRDRNLRLFWSLLQGVKRACEFADEAFIQESMEKHSRALTREHPWDDILQMKYQEEFDEFFKDFRADMNQEYEISTSSSFEYTRSEGGARAYLLDEVNGVNEWSSNEVSKFNWSVARRCIVRSNLRYANYLYGMYETKPGVVKELRGCLQPEESDLRSLVAAVPGAMVQAILEPLKVRLITKGPAANYFFAKRYQKSLFKYLQRFPQFELTGDPLREDHIYRMIEREKNVNHFDFTHFVSGDYSAATDNLGIHYTKTGMFASLYSLQNLRHNVLSSEDKKILQGVLFEHIIQYPERYGVPTVVQSNGQLMGSPLSFPFLCACNLIAYKLSMEEFIGEKISFRDLPCLVNGDDILFRTNPDHYEVWKRHVDAIGFTLSVGKNYIHEKVLTINSTMFVYHNGNTLRKIDYCNFGLLSGTSKLGGSRGEVREKALDLADAYVRSVCGATNKPLAMSKFIARNKEDLSKVTHRGRFNLFVPRAVGGLGFPTFDGLNFHVTRFQALLAKKVIKEQTNTSLFGFKTKNKSNMVMGYESKNSKKWVFGYGPRNWNEREVSQASYNRANISYVYEDEVKWFTTIPTRYNANKMFPFKLKKDDSPFNYEGAQIIEQRFGSNVDNDNFLRSHSDLNGFVY